MTILAKTKRKKTKKTRLLYKTLTKAEAKKRKGQISDKISTKRRKDIIDAVTQRIKKHKLRFDLDYEEGLYDMTPQEADVYDDAINDILTIINKLQYS